MLDLKFARAWHLCRICEQVASLNPDIENEALVFNYGKEYAHRGCLEAAERGAILARTPLVSQLPPPSGWTDLPTRRFWYWLKRGSASFIVFAEPSSDYQEWKLYQCGNPRRGEQILPDQPRAGDCFLLCKRPEGAWDKLEGQGRGEDRKVEKREEETLTGHLDLLQRWLDLIRDVDPGDIERVLRLERETAEVVGEPSKRPQQE